MKIHLWLTVILTNLLSLAVMAQNRVDLSNIKDETARKRLWMVEERLINTYQTLPQLGSPRFYLTEYLIGQTKRHFTTLYNSKNDAIRDKDFIPRDRELAVEFVKIIAAYQAVETVSPLLTFSTSFLPELSKEAQDHLYNLGAIMQLYKNDLDAITIGKFSGTASSKIFTIEDIEKAKTAAQVDLFKYFAYRIETYYDGFVPGDSHEVVQSVIQDVRQIKSSNIKDKLSDLIKKREWALAKQMLADLPLPESGSIDGIGESYEKVMSVQFCMDMLNHLVTWKAQRLGLIKGSDK